ncbi:MAG TPA: DUF4253 domain-containing protein [Longimicrobium sp.]|nr:DUF4253 domain-containing protein [Longimicrobium sp.]
MWPALLVYSVYWVFLSRRQMRNTWPEVAVTLLLQLAMFGGIAWLFPPWAWKVTLLASITMPWWIAPVQIWRGTRLPLCSGEAAYDPERHPVPPELRPEVERQVDVLARAGLVRLGTFWHQAHGGTTLRVPMESPDGLEMAMVTGYGMVVREGTPAEHRRQEVDCAVAVAFGSGRRLVVANAVPEMMPRTPGAQLEMLPVLRDPAQLLAFARAYRARFAADERLEPVRGAVPPLEHLQALERRNWQGQVASGRFRILPDDHVGFTLHGALLALLGQQAPFRQLAGLRIRLRERRLMRDVGFARPRAGEGRWWFKPTDVIGTAALAMLVATLLPVPPLSLPLPPMDFAASGLSAASALREDKPYALPAGFTVPADFPGAVRALEQLAGMRAVPLEVEDEWTGEMRRGEGMEVRFAADRTDSLIARAGPLFRARGFLLFRSGYTFGAGGEPEHVALHPRDDAAEVMRFIGANGTNYGIDTDSVVAWFGRLHARHPFVLTGAGTDYVEGRLLRKPTRDEARALAREFHEFCPDVVTQGTRTVAALAGELAGDGVIYCWWD